MRGGNRREESGRDSRPPGQGGQVGVGEAIGRGEKEDQIGGGGQRMRIGEEVGGR